MRVSLLEALDPSILTIFCHRRRRVLHQTTKLVLANQMVVTLEQVIRRMLMTQNLMKVRMLRTRKDLGHKQVKGLGRHKLTVNGSILFLLPQRSFPFTGK